MKTWLYFYIEHYMKFAKPFEKKSSWVVWHSCFDYLHRCGYGKV
jgi:hypothetical protein